LLVGPQHLAGALHALYLIEPVGVIGHHSLTPFSTGMHSPVLLSTAGLPGDL
jgi:hypothetical protein